MPAVPAVAVQGRRHAGVAAACRQGGGGGPAAFCQVGAGTMQATARPPPRPGLPLLLRSAPADAAGGRRVAARRVFRAAGRAAALCRLQAAGGGAHAAARLAAAVAGGPGGVQGWHAAALAARCTCKQGNAAAQQRPSVEAAAGPHNSLSAMLPHPTTLQLSLVHPLLRQDGRALEGQSVLGPFFGIGAMPDRGGPRCCLGAAWLLGALGTGQL